MLLRNLEPPKLCNGTRLLVKNLQQHVIEAVILDGKYKKDQKQPPQDFQIAKATAPGFSNSKTNRTRIFK